MRPMSLFSVGGRVGAYYAYTYRNVSRVMVPHSEVIWPGEVYGTHLLSTPRINSAVDGNLEVTKREHSGPKFLSHRCRRARPGREMS